METSYLELRQKEVVSLCDGKRLGRICDVVFTFPEGKVEGIVVPGKRGFHFGKAGLFLDLRDIKKIGIDVILVDIKTAPPKKDCKRGKWERDCSSSNSANDSCRENGGNRRDYGEYE